MSGSIPETSRPAPPPVPRGFWEYLRSLGPGIIVVLTWLGAGDVVEAGVSGGNYGYRLMWVVVVALMVRFLFVSLMAKYHLCNPRGEGVVDALCRLHPFYAPGLLIVSVVMGHVYGAYMAVGMGETWAKLTGRGTTWAWALAWTALALLIAFRPGQRALDLVFKLLLGMLSVSFVGVALWIGPSPGGILRGTLTFELPPQVGPFDSALLAVGMIGAVGGSLMNLAYPYFLDQKGWRGPQYRKVQTYDFLIAIVVMIVLDLAVWTLGAELVHKRGRTVHDLEGLTSLLAEVLGEPGRVLFHLGVFAAVFTSVIGHAVGLGAIAADAHRLWRKQTTAPEVGKSPIYRGVVLWVLLSALVWTAPGMPDFVTLTLIGQSLQVVLIPFLAGGLWWITASRKFLPAQYRNRPWENAIMVFVFALALWGAYGSVKTVSAVIGKLVG
jgi:Mn2+/Fe2+ NRAMP family transporter